MKRVQVGNVDVISLCDNRQRYAAAGVYPEAGEALQRFRDLFDGEGRVELNFGCFLLVADGLRALVDTGWGPENRGRLLEELAASGTAPEAVDMVVFTHLHGDHTGWNIDRASGRPTFPRARYYVPLKDWDHYRARPQVPASFTRDVAPLQSLGCLELFEGEKTLSPSLTAVPTPGHTLGHTSIVVDSAGQRGLVLGDVVLSAVDAAEPEWRNSFDGEHDLARQTRLAMLERCEREGMLVAASHLPDPGLGRFARVEGRRFWQAV